MIFHVRCTSETCRAFFAVPHERMGHNIYCLYCGTKIPAKPMELEEWLAQKQAETPGRQVRNPTRFPLAALLEDIRSLWNVGAIFRTADSCGFEKLILTGITGTPPNPKISKTALGADEQVSWEFNADAKSALLKMIREGYTPVALERSEKALPLHQIEWPGKVCLVVGNEVSGVSEPLLALCAQHAYIPMHGIKESLNVAVAFGIAAYQASTALAPQPESTENTHPASSE